MILPEVRAALADAMERVSILAQVRAAMYRERQPSLEAALEQLCMALRSQGKPRGISVVLAAEPGVGGLSEDRITTLTPVVNELTTNAIKHAFEEGKTGHIHISIARDGDRGVTVVVDDDGLPFPEPSGSVDGMGLGLVKRLIASIGGVLIPPPQGKKLFELRVPVDPQRHG